jgi:hypothetical protein
MFVEFLVDMVVAIFRVFVNFFVCVSVCEYVFTIVHICLSVFTLQTFLCVCVHKCVTSEYV